MAQEVPLADTKLSVTRLDDAAGKRPNSLRSQHSDLIR
jgi:hypothetical protein